MITDIGMRAAIETAKDHFEPRITRRATFMEWLRLMLLRRRIDAMLRKATGPAKYQSAATLPEHLRRDIGLMPPL